MPGFGEGLVQGLKRRQQEIHDEQRYTEELALRKKQLSFEEEMNKFRMAQAQRENAMSQLTSLVQPGLASQGLQINPQVATQEPQSILEQIQGAPIAMIDKLRGIFEGGHPQYAEGVTPAVIPQPGYAQQKQYVQQKQALDLQEQQANIEYKKSQAQAQRSLAATRQSKITDATKLGFKGSDAVRLVNDFNDAYLAAVKHNADATLLGESSIELPLWEDYLDTAYKALNYTGKSQAPPELPAHIPTNKKATEQDLIDSLKGAGAKTSKDFDINLIMQRYPYLNKQTILKAFGA